MIYLNSESGKPAATENQRVVIVTEEVDTSVVNPCGICGKREKTALQTMENCCHAVFMCRSCKATKKWCPAGCPSKVKSQIFVIKCQTQ